jgi:hypothetical protein
MNVVTTPHIADVTPSEDRTVLDEPRVKTWPDHGIHLHPAPRPASAVGSSRSGIARRASTDSLSEA